MTIWLAYLIAAVGASALFVAAGWRSWIVARSPGPERDRLPVVIAADPDPASHADSSGDAAEAIDGAIERLRPIIEQQRIRIEVATQTGLQVRTRSDTLAGLVSDLLDVGIQAEPSGRFLFTASRQGGRVDITLSDDGASPDADLRRSQCRSLEQRVALLGGSLEVASIVGQGTSMTLRLAGVTSRPACSVETVHEPWPEVEPQLL